MMRRALLPLLALLMSGCDLEQSAHYLGSVAHAYCIASEAARASMREVIAQQIAPHRLELHCAGDAQP